MTQYSESVSGHFIEKSDFIDDKTMQYYNGNGIYFQIGGFTWSGHFTWIDIPEAEKARTNYEPTAPVRTPTMAGKKSF